VRTVPISRRYQVSRHGTSEWKPYTRSQPNRKPNGYEGKTRTGRLDAGRTHITCWLTSSSKLSDPANGSPEQDAGIMSDVRIEAMSGGYYDNRKEEPQFTNDVASNVGMETPIRTTTTRKEPVGNDYYEKETTAPAAHTRDYGLA
jgi:hypothetical protein